jgi:hypothetical protein
LSCPICEKRPTKRFCPAKGEKICAICCGRERETTIDCPSDCSYLIAAHRYETEHRAILSAEELPYRSVEVSPDFVYERWAAVTEIAESILAFRARNKELTDDSVSQALTAIAETYRTLGTGIYYERPPDAPLARSLYGNIAASLENFRKKEAERTGFSSWKESDIFRLLVFLLRVEKQGTNGRPRSRAFLDFLRTRFSVPETAPSDAPRIIMP